MTETTTQLKGLREHDTSKYPEGWVLDVWWNKDAIQIKVKNVLSGAPSDSNDGEPVFASSVNCASKKDNEAIIRIRTKRDVEKNGKEQVNFDDDSAFQRF